MSLDAIMCADTRKPDMSRDELIAAIIKEMESTWGTNAVTSAAPSAEALYMPSLSLAKSGFRGHSITRLVNHVAWRVGVNHTSRL